jgi:hypothetical protein
MARFTRFKMAIPNLITFIRSTTEFVAFDVTVAIKAIGVTAVIVVVRATNQVHFSLCLG